MWIYPVKPTTTKTTVRTSPVSYKDHQRVAEMKEQDACSSVLFKFGLVLLLTIAHQP